MSTGNYKFEKKIFLFRSEEFYKSFELDSVYLEWWEKKKQAIAERLEKKDKNWYNQKAKELKRVNLCFKFKEPSYIKAAMCNFIYSTQRSALKIKQFSETWARLIEPVKVDFSSGGYTEIYDVTNCPVFTFEVIEQETVQRGQQSKIFKNYVNNL